MEVRRAGELYHGQDFIFFFFQGGGGCLHPASTLSSTFFTIDTTKAPKDDGEQESRKSVGI